MGSFFEGKCNLSQNETLGRFVTANKQIRLGEGLLHEVPAIITPQWDSNLICSKCYRPSLVICQKCQVFPLCITCTYHCGFDCNFFQEHPDLPKNILVKNFKLYGPLKCLLFLENPANEEFAQSLLQMEAHLNERRGTPIWNILEETVVKPIKNSGIAKFFTKINIMENDIIQRICGIFDVNSFEIRGPDENPLRGCYLKASLVAHNCVPNVAIAVDQDFEMKVYATVDIMEDELIYYNYTSPLMGTTDRRNQLKLGKYFDCNCQRCEDPTELGSFMSAIKCQTCIEQKTAEYGYILNFKTTWMCNQCSKTSEPKAIESFLLSISEKINAARDDIREMEMLIMRLSDQLHDNHYFLIDLKQNVASILRSISNDPTYTGGKGLLKRKLQLCEQILPVLRIVQPGISRLTGIALYEYYGPLIQITRMEVDGGKENFMREIVRAEEILKEAASMLIYEPINTPEGTLAKQILDELKELRTEIKNLN